MYHYLLQPARRSSSTAAYTTGLNNFIFFCHTFLILVPSLLVPGCMAIPTVTPVLFGHYVAWLFRLLYALNTIRSYKTAIKMRCREHQSPDPTIDTTTVITDISKEDI
jgi:hypothetical protein